jgi:membrane-bound metal-dependent hydrolase YbcI (DUF457 family)
VWPWEHLAFGYLLWSLWLWARGRSHPSDLEALVLVFATQLPDLVDKPLAWQLGVLPGGRSLMHSLLIALPVVTLVLAVTYRRGALSIGVAFTIGYLSHILGDIITAAAFAGPASLTFLFWPVLPVYGGTVDVRLYVFELMANYVVDLLSSPVGLAYLVGEVLMFGAALAFWVSHGTPGWVFKRAPAGRS